MSPAGSLLEAFGAGKRQKCGNYNELGNITEDCRGRKSYLDYF
jgi:hypothetical protein